MSSVHRPTAQRYSSSSASAVKNNDNAETSDALAASDYYTRYPNSWSKIRSVASCQSRVSDAHDFNRESIREPAAEMLGTMILTLFGTAGNCQAVLSTNTGVASSPKGDYLSLALGWACGQLVLLFYRLSD